jgi:hypothetical protein
MVGFPHAVQETAKQQEKKQQNDKQNQTHE